PASVGGSGDELFVANRAQDGTRPLKATPASYAAFRIASDGRLTPIGNPVEVPPGSSPTQTYVPPHTGHLMIATEESGPFRAFTIGGDGRLAQAPGSPLPLGRSCLPPRQAARRRVAPGAGRASQAAADLRGRRQHPP